MYLFFSRSQYSLMHHYFSYQGKVDKLTAELSKAEEACSSEKRAMEELVNQKAQEMETVEIEIHQFKLG